MQFGKQQRDQFQANWGPTSWFYQKLGQPIREIIAKAYGVTLSKAPERQKCQEDVSLALTLFARKVGCDKSHAVHALLSGSVQHLIAALQRKPVHEFDSSPADGRGVASIGFDSFKLERAWQDSFREIQDGSAW